MSNLSLRKLRIFNRQNEIYNVDFTDSDHFDRDREKPLTTVLIGTNGSGKSYLLKMVADVFNYLDAKLVGKAKFRYDYFYLEYCVDNKNYIITMKNNSIIKCVCNAQDIQFTDIQLPSKVLAVSFMINDKFLFERHRIPHTQAHWLEA